MKKIRKNFKSLVIFIITIMMMYMMLFATVQNVEAASKNIGTTKALNIALKDAKLTKKKVTKCKCELEKEDKEYEVEFKSSTYKYEYAINMYSGNIKKSEYERIKKDKKHSGSKISTKKAKKIAINDLGIKSSKVKSLNVKLKKSGKYKYYKVKFKVGKHKYEYEINAFTKTINEREYEI